VLEQGILVRRIGPILATACGTLPRDPAFNLIQGAEEPGAVADGHLGAAIDWLRSGEITHYLVTVDSERPGTAAAEEWLGQRGYERAALAKRYLRAATAPPPRAPAPAVEVRPLPRGGDEGIGHITVKLLDLPEEMAFLFMDLPALPHWRCYAVLLEGEPAGAGTMRIADGIATFGLDGTLPPARRRGGYRALLERRVADAAKAGCDFVQAFACEGMGYDSAPTEHTLRSLNFEQAGEIVFWRRPVR
jgi:hypothetical protein